MPLGRRIYYLITPRVASFLSFRPVPSLLARSRWIASRTRPAYNATGGLSSQMTTQPAPAPVQADAGATTQLSVRFEQQVLPPRHPDHATPDPMVRRRTEFRFADGAAALVEQTDYGHPGRFNPPQVRRVPPRLAPRQEELARVAEALATLSS